MDFVMDEAATMQRMVDEWAASMTRERIALLERKEQLQDEISECDTAFRKVVAVVEPGKKLKMLEALNAYQAQRTKELYEIEEALINATVVEATSVEPTQQEVAQAGANAQIQKTIMELFQKRVIEKPDVLRLFSTDGEPEDELINRMVVLTCEVANEKGAIAATDYLDEMLSQLSDYRKAQKTTDDPKGISISPELANFLLH